MMEPVLFQTILGNDWNKLPEMIRQHYRLPSGNSLQNRVSGTMLIDYPWFVTPILKLIRLFGGLIDAKGANNAVTADKRVDPRLPSCIFWRREIITSDGETIIFASRMEHQQGNELIEFIGGGFGLYLKVTVEDNKLVYRSNDHLWQIGKLKIPIPDVLMLGHATITETAVSDDEFELDFRSSHPWFGDTYRYGGRFKISPPDNTALENRGL